MIIAADWVLPVTGKPIRDGGVLIRNAHIKAVGPASELVADHPSARIEQHPGCAIVPGFVNAHTHLSLTILRGLVSDAPFDRWLRGVAKATGLMSDDDFAASASLGALECLRHGVTAVGDIVYGPEPMAACADAGVGGVFFWEMLGIDAGDLSGELAEREFPAETTACNVGRSRCGISPHTAFTAGPELLRATWNVAARHHAAYAIHVAESVAERELMLTGEGALGPVSRRLARGFVPPRTGTVAYLDNIGVLKGSIAVHCVHLEPGDTRRLKRSVASVVLCPRSNRRLRVGDPPVDELFASGVRLAIGTDSAASNDDLNLLEDARLLRKIASSLSASRLLRMLTIDGAQALGMQDVIGSLEVGKSADLVVRRIGRASDPEDAIVSNAADRAVSAVMTQGIWRIRDGEPSFPMPAVERQAAKAQRALKAALARSS